MAGNLSLAIGGPKAVRTGQGWTATVEFDDSKLLANLSRFDDQVKRIITGIFEYSDGDAVSYAKTNAPWTDRTGAARAGLNSGTDFGPNYWELYLAHAVAYGIFLEVAHSGKYQIILPTIMYTGKLIMSRLNHALERVEAIA